TEHEIGEGGPGVGAVESELAARGARLAEGDTAVVHFAAELQEVLAFLPGERVRKRRNGVGTNAGTDLALQVVHAEAAIGTAHADGRRSVFFGKARNQRQAHFTDHVEIRIVGGAEDFRLVETVPAAAQFVNDGWAENARPGY